MTLLAHKGAVDLLLKILETKSARMVGSVMLASYGEATAKLFDAGLLLKVGQSECVAAMDDFEDEPTRVEWSPEQECHGYYARNGRWVCVPEEELAVYGVKMPAFLAQLLVRCQRVTMPANEALIPDRVWDLGSVKLDGRSKSISVWFVRRLFDADHRKAVEAMAAKRPPADTRVIITSTDNAPELQAPNHITVALRDVRDAAGGIAIDPAIVSKRLDLVPRSASKPIRHSADYGMIYIGSETYKFTGVKHRAILEILVDAYNRNNPVLLTAKVLEEVSAGAHVTNLARAFKGNEHWRKFIKEDAGHCWIEI